MSILFSTVTMGASLRSYSVSWHVTSLSRISSTDSETSTTSKTRSAWYTDPSVDLNESTSQCGKSEEPYRIGDQYLAFADLGAASGCPERCEQTVLALGRRVEVGVEVVVLVDVEVVGEAAQERRLSGVSVAGKCTRSKPDSRRCSRRWRSVSSMDSSSSRMRRSGF